MGDFSYLSPNTTPVVTPNQPAAGTTSMYQGPIKAAPEAAPAPTSGFSALSATGGAIPQADAAASTAVKPLEEAKVTAEQQAEAKKSAAKPHPITTLVEQDAESFSAMDTALTRVAKGELSADALLALTKSPKFRGAIDYLDVNLPTALNLDKVTTPQSELITTTDASGKVVEPPFQMPSYKGPAERQSFEGQAKASIAKAQDAAGGPLTEKQQKMAGIKGVFADQRIVSAMLAVAMAAIAGKRPSEAILWGAVGAAEAEKLLAAEHEKSVAEADKAYQRQMGEAGLGLKVKEMNDKRKQQTIDNMLKRYELQLNAAGVESQSKTSAVSALADWLKVNNDWMANLSGMGQKKEELWFKALEEGRAIMKDLQGSEQGGNILKVGDPYNSKDLMIAAAWAGKKYFDPTQFGVTKEDLSNFENRVTKSQDAAKSVEASIKKLTTEQLKAYTDAKTGSWAALPVAVKEKFNNDPKVWEEYQAKMKVELKNR